jgi:SnoaL-like domain
MELTAEDRWAIGETIALHGHLFDNAEFDRLGELFAPDIAYDVTDAGMAPLHGIAEILRATQRQSSRDLLRVVPHGLDHRGEAS